MPETVIAHHLIFHGYGHWLPNDPRGSGSTQVRDPKLADLGPIHFGRKPVQPPRSELKAFYRQATPRLTHDPIWFDLAKRQAIADAFAQAITRHRYTVWSCAVLSNHAHLCVRRHRDSDETIWHTCADTAANFLRALPDIPPAHPIWADRPYAIFLYTPDDIRRTINYINGNPAREHLPPQHWPFVQPYNNWPFHKPR